MVEIACKPYPGFVASRLEAGRRPSYTVDTVKRVLKGSQSDRRLFFLVGGDAFDELKTWKGWQDLVQHDRVYSGVPARERISGPSRRARPQAGWPGAARFELDDTNSPSDRRGDTGTAARSTRVCRETGTLQFRSHAELIESLGEKLGDAGCVARFNLKAMQRKYRLTVTE